MNILQLSCNEELSLIKRQADPFACLLRDECPCTANDFRDCTSCVGIALIGRSIGSIRRGKQLIQFAATIDPGCARKNVLGDIRP